MNIQAIENLAAGLTRGEPPAAQPWDVGGAVRLLADRVCHPASPIGHDEVRRAAGILNKYRHYDHTRMLARAWRACREFDPTIAKHHAQALINLSALDEAEELLREALEKAGADAGAQAAAEILEYQGLLGRLQKARFVLTGDLDALVKATKVYQAQYDDHPRKPYWHGINAAALRAREEREGVARADAPASSTLATAIYAQVTRLHQQDSSDPWLAATASEASLALEACDQAELWLYRFLHHPSVHPFDVESYDRQLREIWQGNASSSANRCADRLAAIMSRHIARTQLQWSVTASAVPAIKAALERDPDAFEKNFLGESTFSVDMVRQMLAACSSIGCVVNTRGERLGTGFLVRGSWLKASFTAEALFITNAHVISDEVPNAIPPRDALVTFEVESAASGKPVFYNVAEVLFTSTPGDLGVRSPTYDDLDVTIVRLKELRAGYPSLPTAEALPLIDAKAKAYVVGHPRGSGLQISLHDSLLLDIDDDQRLIHYRTPTDPGSSGSPVFNADWDVMGVHHGGSKLTPRLHGAGTYEANEAISLSAVRHRLNA